MKHFSLNAVLLMLSICLINQCSKDEQENNGIVSPDKQIVDTSAAYITHYVAPDSSIILADSTILLTNAGLALIDSSKSTGSFIEFRKKMSMFTEGSIVIGGSCPARPHGILGKIEMVDHETNSTTLYLSPVKLNDAFEKLQVTKDTSITSCKGVVIDSIRKGVRLLDSAVLKKSTAIATTLPTITFDNVILYDKDANEATTTDQVSLNGYVSFSLGFNTDLKISFPKIVDRVSFSAMSSFQSNIKVKGSLDYQATKVYDVLRYSFPSFTIMAGPVPLVFTPVVTVQVTLDGKITANTDLDVSQTASYTAGVSYTSSNGWTPVSEFSANFASGQPVSSGSCGLKVTAGPKLSLLLYDMAGPYVTAGGYLDFQYSVKDTTPEWYMYGGFSAGAGFDVSFLNISWGKNDIIDFRRLIDHRVGADNGWTSFPIARAAASKRSFNAKIASAITGAPLVLFSNENVTYSNYLAPSIILAYPSGGTASFSSINKLPQYNDDSTSRFTNITVGSMCTDSSGTLHIIAVSSVFYTAGGSRSSVPVHIWIKGLATHIELIDTSYVYSDSKVSMSITAGNGTLFAGWLTSNKYAVATRTSSGWVTEYPQSVIGDTIGWSGPLHADNTGNVHYATISKYKLVGINVAWIIRHTWGTAGNWHIEDVSADGKRWGGSLPALNTPGFVDMSIDRSGVAHFAWAAGNHALYYQKAASGTYSMVDTVINKYSTPMISSLSTVTTANNTAVISYLCQISPDTATSDKKITRVAVAAANGFNLYDLQAESSPFSSEPVSAGYTGDQPCVTYFSTVNNALMYAVKNP